MLSLSKLALVNMSHFNLVNITRNNYFYTTFFVVKVVGCNEDQQGRADICLEECYDLSFTDNTHLLDVGDRSLDTKEWSCVLFGVWHSIRRILEIVVGNQDRVRYACSLA